MSQQSSVKIGAVGIAAVLVGSVALSACGSSSRTAPGGEPTQGGVCSDLARVVARSQGIEFSECGGAPPFRTLVPLDGHLIMAWTPETGDSEVWGLDGQGLVRDTPNVAYAYRTIVNNHILLGLAGPRLLDYDQKSGEAIVWELDPTKLGSTSAFPAKLAEQKWFIPPTGRNLVHLESDYVLDWQPGNGTYSVVRYGLDPRDPFVRFEALGSNEAFRRGHRLLALAPGKLLEWHPRTSEFRIWRYSLDRLPGDIFDASPEASGTWPALTADRELLRLTPDRIAEWDRTGGTITVRKLDPAGSDPLSGPVLGVTQDDRFRSKLPAWERATSSPIRRLVILFQAGRAFDTYFGKYCRASPGSSPECEDGPECCEAMPDRLDEQVCVPISDDADFVPNEDGKCQAKKIASWAAGHAFQDSACGDPRDFACVDPAPSSSSPASTYFDLAPQGVLADRYFQSVAQPAELNLIYFGLGGFGAQILGLKGTALGSLLAEAQIPSVLYLGDPTDTHDQQPPLYYDGTWSHFRSLEEFRYDLSEEQLPPISILVPAQDANESGASPGSIQRGAALVSELLAGLQSSQKYSGEFLLMVGYLSGGGYFDHVPPPAPPPLNIDASNMPYGPRVPLLGFGPFVRAGKVSHLQLEHCSLTKFIEWNWFNGDVGQLGGRDRYVNNIGGLLDASALGVVVP